MVLHVDDDEVIRDLIAVILEGVAVDVASAEGGAQGLEAAQELGPDLLLVDMLMPGMDGIELCRRLKAQPRFQATPILMVTAQDQMKDVEQAMASGIDGYISKPFEPAELRARIAQHLKLAPPALPAWRLDLAATPG